MEVNSVRYLRTPANQLMLLSLSGPSNLLHGKGFGRVGLHSGASSSFGWLSTIDVGQQDRLVKRGLPHSGLSFFDKEEETIQHILVGYVFTGQIWFSIL